MDEPAKISQELDRISEEIDKLHTKFEQYFLGREKKSPQIEREKLLKRLRLIQSRYLKNTMLRFKFGTVMSKMVTYGQYWDRIFKEMENGTFDRRRFRVSEMIKPGSFSEKQNQKVINQSSDEDLNIKKLYEEFVQKTKEIGKKPTSIDKFRAHIIQRKERLIKEKKCHDVDFKVKVKDGKVILQAIAKRRVKKD